jgi:signal transduction histidine kinase
MADQRLIRVLAVSGNAGVLEDLGHLFVSPGGSRPAGTRASLEDELFGAAVRHDDFPEVDLVTCRQGGEAVQAVRGTLQDEHGFALAFIDMQLSAGLDWLQAAEQIRAWDPGIYIVVLAGASEVHPLDVCARVPPADRLFFLQKPFEAMEVQQLVLALSAKRRVEGTGLARRRPPAPLVAGADALVAGIQHHPLATMAFDRHDALLAANPELLRLLPELAEVLAAGMSYGEIQNLIADRLLPEDTLFRSESWVRDRLDWHARGGGLLEQKLAGGRWVLLIEREAPHEVTYCHYLDITELKTREFNRTSTAHMTAVAQSFAGLCERLELLRPCAAGRPADREIADDPQVTVLHGQGPGLDPARASALTRKLTAVAQRMRLDPEPTGLNDLLSGTLREARDLPSSLQVEVIEGAGLWEVLVDRDAMAMALLELVCNAAEAMADGGRLTLETANVRLTRDFTATRSAVGAGDYVRLTVRDNGPGLSTELADRALNPFFTSKSETGHEGLGLSVVYGVVCQSGGHMEIDCGEGEGFKVDLYIPRMAADDGVLGADVHVVSTKRRTTR